MRKVEYEKDGIRERWNTRKMEYERLTDGMGEEVNDQVVSSRKREKFKYILSIPSFRERIERKVAFCSFGSLVSGSRRSWKHHMLAQF